MDLSVIIPTRDRPGVLRLALAALEQQTLSGQAFEVLLVDDGSGPAALREIRALRPALGLHLIEKGEPGGLSSARNLGAAQASGRLLLFLDDDVVLAPEALAEHLRCHAAQARPAVVVGALAFPPDFAPSAFLHYLERVGHFDVYRDPARYPGGWPPVPPVTGNTSIDRGLFHAVGRYDESFQRYGGEDLDLGYRLQQAGAPIIYHPKAFGHHHHHKDFVQFCRDVEAAGESLIQVYRKHPEIRAAKKIDLLEDPISALPAKKRASKAILTLSLASPWLLSAVRRALVAGAPHHAFRHLLFPFFRWVAHYHYALGMRSGLAKLP